MTPIVPNGKTISLIGAIGVISVIAISMTFMTGCSADPNQTSANNSLLLYGKDKTLEKNAKAIASRLSIPESNVIKIDSYGKFITILRQQKKSKGRIKRLFLHFHGYYYGHRLSLGNGKYLGGKELGETLAPYVASDALIHLMGYETTSTYHSKLAYQNHDFNNILKGLKTDKKNKLSSFTIIGYNVRIQITEDGYVRPSLGDDPYNPYLSFSEYNNIQKVIGLERDGKLGFEIIKAPSYKSEVDTGWLEFDEEIFKWEYKF